MASKKAKKDLVQIQDACIRIICKKPKTTNVTPLYREMKMLWLPKMITLELAKYGHKLLTNNIRPPSINWQNQMVERKHIIIQHATSAHLTYKNILPENLIRVICAMEYHYSTVCPTTKRTDIPEAIHHWIKKKYLKMQNPDSSTYRYTAWYSIICLVLIDISQIHIITQWQSKLNTIINSKWFIVPIVLSPHHHKSLAKAHAVLNCTTNRCHLGSC